MLAQGITSWSQSCSAPPDHTCACGRWAWGVGPSGHHQPPNSPDPLLGWLSGVGPELLPVPTIPPVGVNHDHKVIRIHDFVGTTYLAWGSRDQNTHAIGIQVLFTYWLKDLTWFDRLPVHPMLVWFPWPCNNCCILLHCKVHQSLGWK